MKSVQLTGIRQMRILEEAEPKIERPGDVKIRVERIGVCGSDVHYYERGRIGSQVVRYPFRVGHECSGTVVEVGKEVTRVKVGDEVAVEPAMPCHRCDQCLAGRENTCRNLGFLGTPGQAEGCMCEYLVMPEGCMFPTMGRMTLEQAAMCEPLSIGVYTVKQSKLRSGERAAILGAGPIGLCVLRCCQAEGVGRIYMTEKIAERIAAAGKAGADWVGNPDREDVAGEVLKREPLGVDAAYECAGQQETIDQAVKMLKPGGRLILVGIPRTERIEVSVDLCRRKEISIVNIRRQNHCVQAAMDLITRGKADVDFIITHHFGLEESVEAFELVSGYRDGVIKAILEVC